MQIRLSQDLISLFLLFSSGLNMQTVILHFLPSLRSVIFSLFLNLGKPLQSFVCNFFTNLQLKIHILCVKSCEDFSNLVVLKCYGWVLVRKYIPLI